MYIHAHTLCTVFCAWYTQAFIHSVYLGHFHELRSVHVSNMLWCLTSLLWSPTSPDSSGHLLSHEAWWWGIPRADITHHLPGLPEECQQGHCRQTALTGEGQQRPCPPDPRLPGRVCTERRECQQHHTLAAHLSATFYSACHMQLAIYPTYYSTYNIHTYVCTPHTVHTSNSP